MNTPFSNDAAGRRELFSAVCDRTVTDEQFQAFETMLRVDVHTRDEFAQFVQLYTLLQRKFTLVRPRQHDSCRLASFDEATAPVTTSVPPVVVVSDGCSTPSYTFGAWSLSYLVAMVLLATLLVIGTAVRISNWRPENIAKNGKASPVGHISGLADCRGKQWSVDSGQWSEITNPQIPKSLNPQIPICLGDRLVLSSGLMQITYDTGAKVLLQGPCTYQIDSDRGGFLAVGKLTALVEKKAKESNPQSLIPNPLFAIRTPTAIVTDLGTEFGVEVEQSGATRSHVFQGSVEVRASNSRRLTTSGELVEILHVGESVRVERGQNNKFTIIREPGQPDRFVRYIPVVSPGSGVLNRNGLRSGSELSTAAPRPSYRLIDLGTLGGNKSYAMSINAAGQVVGAASNASGALHAFLYSDGAMKELGVPGIASYAYDINGHGQIVGQYATAHGHKHAFLYSNGTTNNLGSLGGHRSCAQAINDIGHVVGCSARSNGVDQAFRYSITKGIQALGTLGGPNVLSRAMGINAQGVVTGYSETQNRQVHAFLFSDTEGMIDLGTLGGNISWGCSINNAGVIAGLSTDKRNRLHTVCFGHHAAIRDLGYLCDFSNQNTLAVRINNAGQVIGSYQTTTHGVTTAQAFLYSGGVMLELKLLVAPNHGWRNLHASDMNDAGQIVGYGIAPNGSMRAFMLVPIKKQRNGMNGKGKSPLKALTPEKENL